MATENESTGEPQALREAYDKLKGDFQALQTSHRSLLATTTFEKAKLNPKHAELFLKVNGDQPITQEAATKFAEEYGLAPAEGIKAAEVATTSTPESTDQGLASMSSAGTQGAGAGNTIATGPKMSQAEFQKLLSNDKNAALKAYTEGRVETAPGNLAAEEAVNKGFIAG